MSTVAKHQDIEGNVDRGETPGHWGKCRPWRNTRTLGEMSTVAKHQDIGGNVDRGETPGHWGKFRPWPNGFTPNNLTF